jgi:hypothetical protein
MKGVGSDVHERLYRPDCCKPNLYLAPTYVMLLMEFAA